MSNWSWMFVRTLHILFIAWMVYAPFSKNETMLVFHAIVSPFLMLHWILSDDGCILTHIEKHIRGLEHTSQSFIHSIVAPIYVIDDTTLKPIVFATTIGLWMITLRQVDMAMIKRAFTSPELVPHHSKVGQIDGLGLPPSDSRKASLLL